MLAQNDILPSPASKSLSGLGLLLLEGTSLQPLKPIRQSAAYQQPGPLYAAIQPLQRQLISICLHNPYWNDFRILHHFHRRRIPLTMGQLFILKAQCGLDNRETICNTLLRMSVHGGLNLTDRQISFIEKNKPEFRDRDLQPSQPGEFIVYECLFGRGIGNLGRVYIHSFIDIFTGYVFGQLSQQRSLAAGVQILINTILPTYRAHNYLIYTILHSSMHTTKAIQDLKEFNQMETDETFSRLGLQWQPLRRKFGVIEKFEKSLLVEHFFQTAPPNVNSLDAVKSLFDQCLVKYNASNRLFSRREVQG